jgi:hypothetical protein
MHYHVALVDDEEKKNQWWCYASTWMLLTRDTKTAQSPLITAAATPIDPKLPKVRLWTDDFASLFQILR